jgi:hypothetical protein
MGTSEQIPHFLIEEALCISPAIPFRISSDTS